MPFFVIFLVVFSFYTNAAFSQVVEIIGNGGFEKGDLYMAQDWKDNSRWADVNVEYDRSFSKDRNGYVQKVTCDKFNNGAVQFIQDDIEIHDNDVYKISFWAKGDLIVPLQVLLRKQGKPYTIYHTKSFVLTEKWKKYSFVAPVHADDASAYFMFKFTSRGEIYLDDVSVETLGVSAVEQLTVAGNLLNNGDFEIGVDKWGVQFHGLGYENEMPIRALELHAEADAQRSKIGRFSLKIPTVKNSRFILTSENIILAPRVNYFLSFWAYSTTVRYFRAGVTSGYLAVERNQSKSIKIGPVWKLYTIQVLAKPSEKNAYFVAIQGRGSGSVWFDGVQLQMEKKHSFVNKENIEVGFQKHIEHPIFILDENIPLTIRVAAHSQTNDCKVKVDSIDYYGKRKTILKEACNLQVNSSRSISFKHPSEKPGYFRLSAEIIQNESVIDSAEYAIGIVPKQFKPSSINSELSPFGGHGRFTVSDLKALSRLGVHWLRMHPPRGTKWSVVEKNKGHFDFDDGEEILMAKNAGFQVLGSLDKTPRWASTAPDSERRFWSYPPENMDDWENYVYNVVSHYKGIIDYWEVWNEPDSNGFLKIPGLFSDKKKPGVYVDLLKRAYRAAKRANPNAIIVGGVATGHPPSRWLKKIFDEGALNYMDIVSFHYYTDGRSGDALDVPLSININKIGELIREKLGRDLPIWETESGVLFPETSYKNLLEISPSYPVPAEQAVAYMVRNYVHLLSSGVEKWFYYSMFTSHRTDRREATGFFEWDGAPRPMAVAYAVLSNKMRGLTYEDSFDINKMLHATKFSGKNRDLLVVSAKLWKNDGFHKASMKLEGVYSSYKVFNVMGNEINFGLSDNSIKFEVSREPVYVVAYKG